MRVKEGIRFSIEIYRGSDSWICSIHDLLQHRHFSYYQSFSIPRKRFTRRFIIDLINSETAMVKRYSEEPYFLIIKYAV